MYTFRFIHFLSQHLLAQVLLPAIAWVCNFFIIRYAVEFCVPSWVTPSFDIGLGIFCVVCGLVQLCMVLYTCRVYGPVFRELAESQF